MVLIINGPNIINDKKTAKILGINANVCSLIDVIVCIILTTIPTIRPNNKGGAEAIITVFIAICIIFITVSSDIKFLPYPVNVFTILPIIKFQPSIIIKNIILKGADIKAGGNIIIPIAISTEETTISITIKGI